MAYIKTYTLIYLLFLIEIKPFYSKPVPDEKVDQAPLDARDDKSGDTSGGFDSRDGVAEPIKDTDSKDNPKDPEASGRRQQDWPESDLEYDEDAGEYVTTPDIFSETQHRSTTEPHYFTTITIPTFISKFPNQLVWSLDGAFAKG